ncbi:putative nuclease HARBI1 [Scylla paramamosain]|uniref:putative nuclease HARBI1 n=1 Tax=Scylla paramamosain TaxID=85552 RepID=UPI003082B750
MHLEIPGDITLSFVYCTECDGDLAAMYSRTKRLELGIYSKLMVELRNEDPNSFQNFMRMSPAMFDELLNRLTPGLTRPSTNYRANLEPGLKLAVTLRHLASGTKYRDMAYGWRVPHNTISKVVREVCQAILEEYLDEQFTCPSTEEGLRQPSNEWMQRWNFPYTIGAIDGKHVACKAPLRTGSECYNYKSFFSIILLAMVSSDYTSKFLWAAVSGNGSASDAHMFNHSELKEGLENANITGWPRPDPLPNNTQDVPYFIVGDDAFSLRTYLMKPYSARNMTREERIYNYRLSRARRVVENAFGIMVNRFQVMLTTMQHYADTGRPIVKACMVLHNLMRSCYPVLQNQLIDRQLPSGEMEPGAWRRGQNLQDTVDVQAPNRDFQRREEAAEPTEALVQLPSWCRSMAGWDGGCIKRKCLDCVDIVY